MSALYFLQLSSNFSEPASLDGLKQWLPLFGLISLGLAIATFLKAQIWPWISTARDKRSLKKVMAVSLLSNEEIKRARQFYIEPFVQIVDPMGREEPRALVGLKTKLYASLDELLDPLSDYRYIILLADSGMGKTSAVINFNIRQVRRLRRRFRVQLVMLSNKNAVNLIKDIKDRSETVLFLDGFDEDPQAIRDHRARIEELMEAAYGFQRVLISCRTHFFASEEEIPRDVGIVRIGARSAGESAEYTFYKLYLSPFTEPQTKAYLKRRYPILRFRYFRRRQAYKIADKIEHLAKRPMLLAHIDALVGAKTEIDYAFEMYEEMVNAWLKREEGFIKDRVELRLFSELLAVDLNVNRDQRQSEDVAREELSRLAESWGIPITDRVLADYRFSTRSLLNRNAAGAYKFAHQSIMEYLFVKRCTEGDTRCFTVQWSPQMFGFYWEMLEKQVISRRMIPFFDSRRGDAWPIDSANIEFLTRLTDKGVPLLRGTKIANQRFKPILETATALCAFILDPDPPASWRDSEVPPMSDDPVLSLVSVKRDFDDKYRFEPIAIHFQGQLSDVNKAAGLQRHWPRVEHFIRSRPAISEVQRRFDGDMYSLTMPINRGNETVAVLIAETSRSTAFRNNRYQFLTGIMSVLGNYLDQDNYA